MRPQTHPGVRRDNCPRRFSGAFPLSFAEVGRGKNDRWQEREWESWGKVRGAKTCPDSPSHARLAPGVIGLCLVMILASMTLVASPAQGERCRACISEFDSKRPRGSLSGIEQRRRPAPHLPLAPGSLSRCTHGTISLGGTQYCSHTTSAPVFLCDSTSCPFTIVGTVDSGSTFYGWNLSGQATVSCEFYCLTTTLTLYAPNPSNHYTASVQLDTTSKPPVPPSCGGAPTMAAPTVQIQSGYRQAWVNWTYTIPSPGFGWSAGFSWSLGAPHSPFPRHRLDHFGEHQP